jgi:hypothetical protein
MARAAVRKRKPRIEVYPKTGGLRLEFLKMEPREQYALISAVRGPDLMDSNNQRAINTIQVTLTAQVKAGIKFDDQAKVYVTWAPALQLYSQGRTKARARRAMLSALQMYLGIAYEKGVLDQVLRTTGLAPVPASSQPSKDSEYISIEEEEILEREHFDVFEASAPRSHLTERIRAVVFIDDCPGNYDGTRLTSGVLAEVEERLRRINSDGRPIGAPHYIDHLRLAVKATRSHKIWNGQGTALLDMLTNAAL